ncbi:MAG: GAF domain-containing sensor histidine kinase [Chloroflexi bacterium]|nr:GAF domain-containing sensor histidine kinase [Chloroflexota bacterium]
MFEQPSNPGNLRPEELEAVYAISRAVTNSINIDDALDEIAYLARPVFIFDNMVVYIQRGEQTLEPAYARAIGRGRSQEAELVWGEATANQVITGGRVAALREEVGNSEDRTGLRYSLGLPLRLEKDLHGALVFIRFGGPDFKPDQIRLAEFITMHVAQLLEHDKLVEKIASLEAERKLDRLQEDFIATVSHELLTPLGFIKGYATTLLRDDTHWDDDTRREFLAIIDEEADRLRELIDTLMDSSRLQAGTLRMKFQPVRLDTFLRDIALRAKSRKGDQEIRVQADSPGLVVPADPARLAQVFDNLLSNAAKYAPEASITLMLSQEEGMAHIRVQDDGPGIAPEHLAQLFKRFYRAPSNNTTVRGTGLGLFICRQIVRAHDGKITVESQLGEGTSFHIHLPIERTQAEDQHITLRES